MASVGDDGEPLELLVRMCINTTILEKCLSASTEVEHMFTLMLLQLSRLQSCPTLCDPIDGSPPGSPVLGILQARTLEWAAISFSNAWKGKVKVKSLSCVWLAATPWTAAYQAPPSMGFSRQEYWSGVPLPSPCSPYGQAILFPGAYQTEIHRCVHKKTWTRESQHTTCNNSESEVT